MSALKSPLDLLHREKLDEALARQLTRGIDAPKYSQNARETLAFLDALECELAERVHARAPLNLSDIEGEWLPRVRALIARLERA